MTCSSVIITGPQGCGKTRNAKRIARKLNLARITDDWTPSIENFAQRNTLYLTNAPVENLVRMFPNACIIRYEKLAYMESLK